MPKRIDGNLNAKFFDAAYAEVGLCPLWDLGKPARQLIRLSKNREIGKRVLDIGCGTGDNALYLAARGHDVTGVDFARTAIRLALRKAYERGLKADFKVHDVLKLGKLPKKFDTVIDFGLLHVLPPAMWPRLVTSLEKALKPGGTYHLLCFADSEPEWGGPTRMSREVLRELFAGWSIRRLRAAQFAERGEKSSHNAWLMSASPQ